MATHATITNSAEIHEAKQIVSATTSDAGKVITPSSVTNGVATLRKLAVADLSDGSGVATQAGVQTLTNKRITRRVSTVTYAAALDVNSDSFDQLQCDSLTGNVVINAPTGTPTEGQKLLVVLTQDAVGGRTVTWNAAFVGSTATASTLSTTSMWEYVWNTSRAKWIQLSAKVDV